MRTDREDSDIFSKQTENATGSMPQQHNNGYVQLSTGANIDSEDSLTGSDQEYENEL
uniref:DUF4025 domain-containing protein n=1 Tax=Syphacia muris TaxID=451379 RepID=A0A0N5A8X5_9BILA